MTRLRATANLNVPLADYRQSVRQWFASHPVVPLRSKCGPRLASDVRGVTPPMVRQVVGLMTALIDAGCSTGVIQASKLEQALRAEVTANSIMGSECEMNVDGLAHDVTNHIQSCVGLLRALRFEDEGTASMQRQHSKSGGFRRKMSSDDWVKIRPLLDKLEVKDHTPTPTKPGPSIAASSPGLSNATLQWNSCELDANGFPTFFRRALAKSQSGASLGSHTSSVADTVFYDSEGFPSIDDNDAPEPKRYATEPDVACEEMQPIAPRSKKTQTGSAREATPKKRDYTRPRQLAQSASAHVFNPAPPASLRALWHRRDAKMQAGHPHVHDDLVDMGQHMRKGRDGDQTGHREEWVGKDCGRDSS